MSLASYWQLCLWQKHLIMEKGVMLAEVHSIAFVTVFSLLNLKIRSYTSLL